MRWCQGDAESCWYVSALSLSLMQAISCHHGTSPICLLMRSRHTPLPAQHISFSTDVLANACFTHTHTHLCLSEVVLSYFPEVSRGDDSVLVRVTQVENLSQLRYKSPLFLHPAWPLRTAINSPTGAFYCEKLITLCCTWSSEAIQVQVQTRYRK